MKQHRGGLPINRVTITLSLAAAFAAGCSVTHLLRPAIAAENITAQVIHTGELEGDGSRRCQRRRHALKDCSWPWMA